MVFRKCKCLLLVVLALPLVLLAWDRIHYIHWVGSTNLEVRFTITDITTGDPVPGAKVEVQSEGGFYDEREKQSFVLVADANGVARKECRNSMCFGTRSWLGITDEFCVHLPWWRYRVAADGFELGEWVELDVLELRKRVQRAGQGRAKLSVPVLLLKKHLERPAAADGGGVRDF